MDCDALIFLDLKW